MCLGATGLVLADKPAGLPTIAFAPSVHVPPQGKSIITITKIVDFLDPLAESWGSPGVHGSHGGTPNLSQTCTSQQWEWHALWP